MSLRLEPYLAQSALWPQDGRHLLTQYTDEAIVVYQAYSASIGQFALEYGFLGGSDFKLDRMTWIKPNFLWMMYRSNWGSSIDQEMVLALWLKRAFFDDLLELAVHTTFISEVYDSNESWKRASARSPVRVQWDPDHDPTGKPRNRRALQLGLRGTTAADYAQSGMILAIEDVTSLVHEQRQNRDSARQEYLLTPSERAYPLSDASVARKLQLTANP